jgi:hypothetical protein
VIEGEARRHATNNDRAQHAGVTKDSGNTTFEAPVSTIKGSASGAGLLLLIANSMNAIYEGFPGTGNGHSDNEEPAPSVFDTRRARAMFARQAQGWAKRQPKDLSLFAM